MTHKELRAALRRLNLTQVEAARLLGVDPSTMRRWLMPPDRKTALPVPHWVPLALAGLEKKR